MNDLSKIANPDDFSWIKVKRHVDDESKSFQDRLYILQEHHVKETEFLLNKCRELAAEQEKLLNQGLIIRLVDEDGKSLE